MMPFILLILHWHWHGAIETFETRGVPFRRACVRNLFKIVLVIKEIRARISYKKSTLIAKPNVHRNERTLVTL